MKHSFYWYIIMLKQLLNDRAIRLWKKCLHIYCVSFLRETAAVNKSHWSIFIRDIPQFLAISNPLVNIVLQSLFLDVQYSRTFQTNPKIGCPLWMFLWIHFQGLKKNYLKGSFCIRVHSTINVHTSIISSLSNITTIYWHTF